MKFTILTLEEAAKYLKVNKATVRKALINKQIPGRKVGRAWLLVKEDIDEYFKGPVIGFYEKLSTGEKYPIRGIIENNIQ